jgi:hypothetical protein
MRLQERIIRLFDMPIDDIARTMPDASSPLWNIDRLRQSKHEVHRQTRSIVFEWLDNAWQVGQHATIQRQSYAPPELARPVYACAEKLAAHYSGKIVRLVLAELAPRGRIAVHRDFGAGLIEVHRCHIPVITNTAVLFYIDMIPHYLEPGIAYEFDNTRRHEVDNRSDARRIHLLCDIMPAALVI